MTATTVLTTSPAGTHVRDSRPNSKQSEAPTAKQTANAATDRIEEFIEVPPNHEITRARNGSTFSWFRVFEAAVGCMETWPPPRSLVVGYFGSRRASALRARRLALSLR